MDARVVEPEEEKLTGFVFKIQANTDLNHRDRVAFLRICSGRLQKGMRLRQTRTGKQVPVNAPLFFFAQDRQVAEEAWPGDVVGIANHGILRIGDTLTEKEALNFSGPPTLITLLFFFLSLLPVVGPIFAILGALTWAAMAVYGVMGASHVSKGRPFRYPFNLRILR